MAAVNPPAAGAASLPLLRALIRHIVDGVAAREIINCYHVTFVKGHLVGAAPG